MRINISKEDLSLKISEGLDNKELAKFFNCSTRTISYRKAAYSLTEKQNLSENEKLKIETLFDNQNSISNIAKTLNRSESTVSSYLVKIKKHSIKKQTIILKNKKCPYCNYESSDWKSVRAHTSKCNNSTHTYYISLILGPIDLKQLENKNWLQIKEMYPLLSSEDLKSLSYRLRKLGFSTKVVWTEDTAKQAIIDWVNTYNKVPTSRDTYNNPQIPSDQWVKQNYSSWTTFIERCGYTPCSSSYGNTVKYKNLTLRSNFEYYFVSMYLDNKYNYIYEQPYPSSNRICDFYLTDYNVFIELAGGLRPEVIQEKIKFCLDKSLKLIVLYPKQVYKRDFCLENILTKLNNL